VSMTVIDATEPEMVAATARMGGVVPLSRLFRVLADPTRLRLVRVLEEGERPAGELVEAVGGLQPRVSTHLACLRHCGLVTTERRGRTIIYRLNIPRLPELLRLAAEVAAPHAEHLGSCHRIGPEWM
jgi:ArsR family transcriptional regulator, cadmium/lead-responsive transcriptional repressor